VSEIDITDPAGQVQKLNRGSRADFAYGQANRVGVYRVAWDGEWQRSFAVNLLDAEESNIEPRTAIHIGAEQVVSDQERRQPRELWKWFRSPGPGTAAAEWYIYNRPCLRVSPHADYTCRPFFELCRHDRPTPRPGIEGSQAASLRRLQALHPAPLRWLAGAADGGDRSADRPRDACRPADSPRQL